MSPKPGSKIEKEGLVMAINPKKRFLIDLLFKFHYIQITKRLNENEPMLHLTELHYTENCWRHATMKRKNKCSASCIELVCQ